MGRIFKRRIFDGKCETDMITVTRLNNSKLVVNAELIRYIESTPDTIITLTSDDRIMVKESTEEIVKRCIEYGRLLRRLMPPT